MKKREVEAQGGQISETELQAYEKQVMQGVAEKKKQDPKNRTGIYHFYQEHVKGKPKEQIIEEFRIATERMHLREQFKKIVMAIKEQSGAKEINIVTLSLNNDLFIRILLTEKAAELQELAGQGIRFAGIIANEIEFDEQGVATGNVIEFVKEDYKIEYVPEGTVILFDDSDQLKAENYLKKYPEKDLNFINIQREITDFGEMAKLAVNMKQSLVSVERGRNFIMLNNIEAKKCEIEIGEINKKSEFFQEDMSRLADLGRLLTNYQETIRKTQEVILKEFEEIKYIKIQKEAMYERRIKI